MHGPNARMRHALDQHMIEVNDNGFIPEGSPLEGNNESRRKEAYPLQRIMVLAAVAARGKGDDLPYLALNLPMRTTCFAIGRHRGF